MNYADLIQKINETEGTRDQKKTAILLLLLKTINNYEVTTAVMNLFITAEEMEEAIKSLG